MGLRTQCKISAEIEVANLDEVSLIMFAYTAYHAGTEGKEDVKGFI